MQLAKSAAHVLVKTCAGVVEGKKCGGRCKRELKLECFALSPKFEDGLAAVCLECQKGIRTKSNSPGNQGMGLGNFFDVPPEGVLV